MKADDPLNRPPYALDPEWVKKNQPDFKSSEAHRHQCEVRLVLSRTDNDGGDWGWATMYLGMVEKKRGKEARDSLAADVKAQWKLGNRGKMDDWRVAQPQV